MLRTSYAIHLFLEAHPANNGVLSACHSDYLDDFLTGFDFKSNRPVRWRLCADPTDMAATSIYTFHAQLCPVLFVYGNKAREAHKKLLVTPEKISTKRRYAATICFYYVNLQCRCSRYKPYLRCSNVFFTSMYVFCVAIFVTI